MVYQLKKSIFSVAILAALAACGGGGGDPAPAPVVADRPEGLYSGTLTGSTSSDFLMLVLENGELWSLYGTQTGASFGAAGFMQGTLSVSGNSFTVAEIRDYGSAPASQGTGAGNFSKAAGTIDGNLVVGGRPLGFSGASVADSLYNYDNPAVLSNASGNWTLRSLDGDTVFLDVLPTGTLSARTASGCEFRGNVASRPSGKNVFDASVTFDLANCGVLAGQTASGIALAYPIGGGQSQLLVALENGTRLFGNAAFGVR